LGLVVEAPFGLPEPRIDELDSRQGFIEIHG
jgi:hypothetical protein